MISFSLNVFLSIVLLCSGGLTSIFYLSFSSRQFYNSNINEAKGTLLLDIMKADDSPFQAVALPFPFIFFGRTFDMLFASPNGALHISKIQPCTSNAFCGDYKKSYYGTVCGLLTDLDPSMSGPNSKISSYLSTSVAVFSFRNIVYFNSVYFNSTAFVSFRISIFPDSRVVIAYDHISYVYRKSKLIFPSPGYWITGLRPPNKNVQNILYTATDLLMLQIQPGVYPAGNTVQTGSAFITCPVSTEWCLSPSLVDIYALDNSPIFTFTVSTLLLSCREEVDFAIRISAKPVSSWPALPSSQPSSSPSGRPTRQPFNYPTVPSSAIPTTLSPRSPQPTLQPTSQSPQSSPNSQMPTFSTVTFPCTVQSNTSNSLICSFVPNPLVLNFTEGVYSVVPAWREASSSPTNYTAMPVSPLLLTVTSTNRSTGNSVCEDTVYGTSALFPSCIAGYCPPSLNAQPASSKRNYYNSSVCTISLPCLSFPCDSTTSPVPYKSKDCRGMCESKNLKSKYFTDLNGTCCSLDRLDCSGVCDGTSVVSNNSAGALYCCPSPDLVDCSGVCGGNKILDACNVCGGKDFTGVTCYNFSAVQVLTGRVDLSLRPPSFDADISVNKNLSISLSFNISNRDYQRIYVVLSVVAAEKTYAPDIYFSTGSSFSMAGNTTTRCVISASYAKLFQGSQSIFKVKHLKVTYKPSNMMNAEFVKTISVYPPYHSSNCAALLSMDACARIPGCIFCFTGSSYRSLLSFSMDGKTGNYTSTVASSQQGRQRSLFTDIVPFSLLSAGQKDTDPKGYCRAGWSAAACHSSATGAAANGPRGWVFSACLFITTLAVAFLSL